MDTHEGDTHEGDTIEGDVALADDVEAESGSSGEPEPESEPSVREGAEPLDPPAKPLGNDAEPLADEALLRATAALVFASPEPISERKLAALLASPAARVRAALEAIGARLGASGLPLELRSIAGGWQILTSADTGDVVQRLFQERKAERISPAALETLAVVAYRQPVTKAEIEAIRGVAVAPILRALVDRGLVKVVGRADQPGHPLQYGTTKSFLDRFGLGGLGDLPRDSELAR